MSTGRRGRAEGMVTRGTTNPNRLRRVDRWLAGPCAGRLRRAADPLVVDLGYGASPVTALELLQRLRTVRPDVQVAGIEIDPERVRTALPLRQPGLDFLVGGFELPLPEGRRPVLVRAFNVLRQYPPDEVEPVWRRVRDRLAPGGLLVDGTCDEVGRRATWIAVDAEHGPVSLSISLRLAGLDLPSEVAPRLPKALIHRNVDGEPVHDFLAALDRCWAVSAGQAGFGVRQRWLHTCAAMTDAWPVLDGPGRWRLGELTVAWDAVRPRAAG